MSRNSPDTVKSLSSDWEPCVVCWKLIGPHKIAQVNEYGFTHHEGCIVTNEIMWDLYDEEGMA